MAIEKEIIFNEKDKLAVTKGELIKKMCDEDTEAVTLLPKVLKLLMK